MGATPFLEEEGSCLGHRRWQLSEIILGGGVIGDRKGGVRPEVARDLDAVHSPQGKLLRRSWPEREWRGGETDRNTGFT